MSRTTAPTDDLARVKDGDPAAFIAERIEPAPGNRVGFGVLFGAYLDWCLDRDLVHHVSTVFARRLIEHGYPGEGAGPSGTIIARRHVGLRLRSAP